MQSDDFPSLPGPKSFGACETSHGNDEWVHPFNGNLDLYGHGSILTTVWGLFTRPQTQNTLTQSARLGKPLRKLWKRGLFTSFHIHKSPRILMLCSTGDFTILTTTVWGMTIHKSQHIPTILRFFHVFSGQKKVNWPIPIYQNLPDPSERHSWVLRSENLLPGQGTKGRIFLLSHQGQLVNCWWCWKFHTWLLDYVTLW